MKRALKQLKKIDELTENTDDRVLVFNYIGRDLSRASDIKMSGHVNKKEISAGQDFNYFLLTCKNIVKDQKNGLQ